jgi:hypothetical protein
MRRLLVTVFAAACVVASTPILARDAGHGNRVAHMRDPTTMLAPAPPTAIIENRIPAPLPTTAGAPVINGPISQPAFRGLNGIGQR